MKKVSLLILVSLILLLSFASCTLLDQLLGKAPAECEHEWTEATCTAPKTCTKCNATEGEAAAHNWADATCTAPKTCKTCNKTEGAPNGHTEVTLEAVAPTCTSTGLTEGKKCSVCNTVTKEQTTVAKLAHTEVDVPGTAATCTTEGLTDGKQCSVCQTWTVPQEVVPAHGHTLETIAGTAATCTEAGLTDGKKCTVCQTVTVEQETIPALGHDSDVVVPGKDATCTQPGLTDGAKCSKCGTETTAQTEIPALGHDTEGAEAVKENDTPATCMAPGSYNMVTRCWECNEVVTSVPGTYPQLDHVFEDYTHDEGSEKCGVDGTKSAYCTFECGTKDTQPDVGTALTHKMPENAVCGETWNCVHGCGYSEVLEHNYSDATCTTLATCQRCQATTGDFAPHTPGEPVVEPVVAPTCTEPGAGNKVVYCTVEGCGHKISSEPTEIPALDHDMVGATCDAPATCKVCGHTEGEAVANHTPVGTVVDGHVVYRCATCSDTFTTEQELVYNGDQTNYLFNKNGDIAIKAEDGQYNVLAGDGADKSQYMLYMPSNDKNTAGTMTGWNAANESFGVFSFRVKLNVNIPNEALRVIVMSSRNNPNWDANGAWSGNSIDILAFMPNLDGTYRVFGNSMTSDTFATVNADEWVDVKMFMHINSEGFFSISYYINGEFCNVYIRDLTDPNAPMSIKNLDINCAYICGYAAPGTGFSLDDVYFGYAKNQEWLFDEHYHKWADATCTAPKTCTACGATEGSALGHVEKTRDENALLPDCTNAGRHDVVTYCERCEVELGRETVTDAALGHLESTVPGTPATCTENGTTDKIVCTREGCTNPVIQDHQPILATGHKDDNADNTCDKCGTELTCDHEGTERIPVKGVAPTCTAKGLSDGEKCAKCGQFTVAQTEIDALGHTEATRRENEVAPTCTADGKYDLVTYCSVCNAELSRANETVDPKLGHAEVAHDAKAPTCTDKGWKAYVTCSRCDYTTYEEVAATGHSYSAPSCVAVETCTVCGATKGQPNPNAHNLEATYSGGKLFYACQMCDYRFDVDTFVYHDGSNASLPGSNYVGGNSKYNNGTNKYASNGDYVYAITDINATVNTDSQMQLWVPGIKNGDGTFKGFSLANSAVGALSFKTKLSLTNAADIFTLKLVESGWGAAGYIDTNLLQFTPFFSDEAKTQLAGIRLSGYSANADDGYVIKLADFSVDADGWTDWIDIKVLLVMNSDTGNLDAHYYIGGEYVNSGSKKVTTTNKSVCSVYGNLNAWNEGTGVMLDDIAFGYSAHKHDLTPAEKDGALVYTCECGTTFNVTNYLGWNGDGSDSGYKNVPNGNVPLNVVDGKYEYIFKPETDVAPDFSAAGNQSGQGWYEYDTKGYAGGQLQMWMPSNNRGESTFTGFSCENNAVGVISFSMKTNMARHPEWDTALTFSVGKPRNASDWSNGGSWTDDSINIFTIEEYQASGVVLKGGKNGTGMVLSTIPVADGWSEWFDVQIVIALSSDGIMNTYYYVNGTYCGMYSRNLTAVGEDGRYLNPQKIEALQISGWTYTPNTGIVFDDFYFGYDVGGHNTLDGQLHKLPANVTCAAPVTCSCGWTGIAATHTFVSDCAPACSACGANNPNATAHATYVPSVVDGKAHYVCTTCNFGYTAETGYVYDGSTPIGAFSKNGDMVSEVVDGVNHVYLKDTDGKHHAADGDQYMCWIPSASTPAEFDNFTCANNAVGFVSFKVNAYTDSSTGVEFKVNDGRGTSAFNWSTTSVGIFRIKPVTSDGQTTVQITGFNGDALTVLPLEEGSKWTGWLDVVIVITLSDDNNMSVDYYINGSYIGNITKGIDKYISTKKISSLYINGYTKGEGTGYYLDDLYFGYTLAGATEEAPAEEPIYNSVIDAANVQSETLKTIVASKLKQCDQCTTVNAQGGTPVYVLADGKDGSEVEALYISRTYAWDGSEKEQFTEFRFAINGESGTGPAVTGISFDYKIKGTVETNDRYTFKDLEGNEFRADAYVQIKTATKHELAGDDYPELSGTDLVLDGEWHTMTITFADPLILKDFLLNLYHFQGELLIANINVEFENPLYNADGSLKVTEIGTRNATEDNTASVTDAALLTIVDAKLKQLDQTDAASEGDHSYGYFVKEGGTSRYVTLVGKDGETVQGVYVSRSVDWDTYADVAKADNAQNYFKSEFRFSLDKTKAIKSISFDYIINGSVTPNRRESAQKDDLAIFQVREGASGSYFDIFTDKGGASESDEDDDDVYVMDGQWHTFTYEWKEGDPTNLDLFLIILSEFQGEMVMSNIVVEYQ